jgi:hypothetical protein
MKKKSEETIDNYIGEAPEEDNQTAPEQAPVKTDDLVVSDAARKSSDQTETTSHKAAKSGNETAKSVTAASKEEKEAEKQRLAEEEAEKQRIEEEEARRRDILQNSLDAPSVLTRRGANWLASAPTPGGVGVLLLALLMFLWIIVPANESGDTRAKLLWYTLTGRTKLKQQYETAENAAAASGGGADFGDSTGGTGNGTVTIAPGASIILSPFEVV